LQLSLFDEKDLAEVVDPSFPGERLIVCRNPLLADERRRKREDLLQATERALAKVVAATSRQARPLRGETEIALRVGKALGRFKMKKHFRLEISGNSFRFERDAQSIAEEAALDGFYVIRTNVPATTLSAEDTVRSYKRLSTVERAFRSLKTVDLHVRPIGHYKAERVRAHILLCMLAYYVEWHIRRALAPLLFDDDDRAAGERRRSSPVAPAQVSLRAEHKAAAKRTHDGLPAQSFQCLLNDLGTIVKNRHRSKLTTAPDFETITTPTPSQERVFSLLGFSHRLP
jgi:hypothetical protein